MINVILFRFVKLEYKAVNSLEEACRVFEEETMKSEGNQFVEGIMFSIDKGVIMTGNMVNSAEPGKVEKFTRQSDVVFLTRRHSFSAERNRQVVQALVFQARRVVSRLEIWS